jgi:hypothetical protein
MLASIEKIDALVAGVTKAAKVRTARTALRIVSV